MLAKRWKAIALGGLAVAFVSFVASVAIPLEYRADAQVLIISRSRYGVDPYTVVKSAERIGENLVQLVKTDDFYRKVVAQPQYTLDLSRFLNVDERTRRKRWARSVNASVVFGTGVLNVSAYHRSPQEAERFAGAAADALVAYGAEYVGGDVALKVVNPAIATRVPVRPNVLVNALVGFVLGVLLMGVLVVKRRG
ncbi:MAG: hypothetical protein A3C90_03280 [Candidatus Magasanikbacteria bacterium RIFCSPHIGHO2_02_FULL_51_14]|uniref:Polysaccharide chain length determinant N-terminal domain-containing protein n=1 Tax=Candidatus Magasanikbacteria bacterium RIFCSPHIGHO2_02_FULL_51_14 TaxID=1798683 RepID=A0A1F6ME50_9BACT|nr:MAG: hypothetical protein A3C90_03280 [Candidatus Magasanikbacteria bacterium RIFCSPHIGHO2_02_FULL_51_14]